MEMTNDEARMTKEFLSTKHTKAAYSVGFGHSDLVILFVIRASSLVILHRGLSVEIAAEYRQWYGLIEGRPRMPR